MSAALIHRIRADGPTVYYPMQGTTATATALDVVAGHNLTWFNSPTFGQSGGAGGQAVRLTAANANYGTIPANSTKLSLTGSIVPEGFSHVFVARQVAKGSIMSILTQSDSGNPAYVYFDTSPSTNQGLRYGMTDGAGTPREYADSTSGLSTTDFVIVHGVRHEPADRTHIYINGVLHADMNPGTGRNSTSTTAMQVGRYNASFTQYFDGWLSHVAIFTKALTAVQVKNQAEAFLRGGVSY